MVFSSPNHRTVISKTLLFGLTRDLFEEVFSVYARRSNQRTQVWSTFHAGRLFIDRNSLLAAADAAATTWEDLRETNIQSSILDAHIFQTVK